MACRMEPIHITIRERNCWKENKSNVHGLALSLRDQLRDTEVRTSHHQSDTCIKMSSAHDSHDSKNSTTEYDHGQAFIENKMRRNRKD